MKDKQIRDAILKALFTNGAGEKADRLLLVKEARGAAKVSNAMYLGGYSQEAVRDLVDRVLAQERGEG